jgi:hypothetical protein
MVVSEHETTLSRGRIPTYLRLCFLQLNRLLLEHSSRNRRDDLWLVNAGVGARSFCCFFIRRQSRRCQMQLLNQLLFSNYNHVCSYDMSCRPVVQHSDPPIQNPVEELTSYHFYQSSGFWPDQFTEVLENLTLIPDVIQCPRSRSTASKSSLKQR